MASSFPFHIHHLFRLHQDFRWEQLEAGYIATVRQYRDGTYTGPNKQELVCLLNSWYQKYLNILGEPNEDTRRVLLQQLKMTPLKQFIVVVKVIDNTTSIRHFIIPSGMTRQALGFYLGFSPHYNVVVDGIVSPWCNIDCTNRFVVTKRNIWATIDRCYQEILAIPSDQGQFEVVNDFVYNYKKVYRRVRNSGNSTYVHRYSPNPAVPPIVLQVYTTTIYNPLEDPLVTDTTPTMQRRSAAAMRLNLEWVRSFRSGNRKPPTKFETDAESNDSFGDHSDSDSLKSDATSSETCGDQAEEEDLNKLGNVPIFIPNFRNQRYSTPSLAQFVNTRNVPDLKFHINFGVQYLWNDISTFEEKLLFVEATMCLDMVMYNMNNLYEENMVMTAWESVHLPERPFWKNLCSVVGQEVQEFYDRNVKRIRDETRLMTFNEARRNEVVAYKLSMAALNQAAHNQELADLAADF